MSRSSQSVYDRHITIFSPDGNLYQVEYAIKAVKSCNLTAIAVKGTNCVCAVTQKKVAAQQLQQDKLLDTQCITSLHSVTKKIGVAAVGMAADCRSILVRARQEVAEFAYYNGYDIPVHCVAQRIADINQVFTQHAYMRLHACAGMFVAIDDEKGPCIYKFDPAGWFAGYKACAVGAKEQEAINALEKVVKKKQSENGVMMMNDRETIQVAIATLQTVLSVDFKAADIEAAYVSTSVDGFVHLTEMEIEEHLTAIAEKD